MMSFSFTDNARAAVRRGCTRVVRFARDEAGVALVEFGIVLPMMVFLFAMIMECSRLMLSYQAAIAGVRDATRYLSRAAAADLCVSGGSVAGYTTPLTAMVRDAATGRSVLAPGVSVDSVTPSYSCIAGSYRQSPVAIAQVTAQITVTFPFAGAFRLLGFSRPDLTTTVTDRARMFGE